MIKLPIVNVRYKKIDGICPRILRVTMDPDHPDRGKISKMKTGSDYWSICYTYAHAGHYLPEHSDTWLERPGNLIQIFPSSFVHKADYKSANPIPRAVIQFDGGEKIGLERLINKSIGHARINDVNIVFGNILRKIGDIAISDEVKGFWKAQQYFCQCIDLLLNSVKNAECEDRTLFIEQNKMTKEIKLKEEVNNYIRKNYMNNITLTDIAKNLYISLSKLTHTYSNIAGGSPIQALLDYRISISKQMILEGYSLQQITDACGFCDSCHFAKTFKKHTGMTPKNYKDSQK